MHLPANGKTNPYNTKRGLPKKEIFYCSRPEKAEIAFTQFQRDLKEVTYFCQYATLTVLHN
jgi:hypothetical protein